MREVVKDYRIETRIIDGIEYEVKVYDSAKSDEPKTIPAFPTNYKFSAEVAENLSGLTIVSPLEELGEEG